MRTIAAVLILAALPALATQPNPSAKQKELIDQLITLTHLDENVRYLLDAMLERMTKASNERRSEDDRKNLERYRQLVREKIDYGEWVRGVYEPLYAKYFTEAQLADLVAFYKTPTGQQMIKALPEIEREAMQTAGAQIREKFAALARQVDEERRPPPGGGGRGGRICARCRRGGNRGRSIPRVAIRRRRRGRSCRRSSSR